MAVIRSILVWTLALLGVGVYAWFVIASGRASLDATEPPTITPPQLEAFGLAAGVLLATNLGAFLGIVIKSGNGDILAALKANEQEPWAHFVGAIAYLVIIGIAVFFYWQSGWNQNGAGVVTTSFSTAAGVFLGAMSSVFNAKDPGVRSQAHEA